MDNHEIFSEQYAKDQDNQDPLRHFRDFFYIPTKADISGSTVSTKTETSGEDLSTYLCGNSLGLQPTLVRQYLEEYLNTWAQKGVFGHFKKVSNTNLPSWLHADDDVRKDMADLIGAKAEEVALMQTLTANLHLLMCSFYKPTRERRKIMIEGRAFPSDHFAVESQIRMHDLDPTDCMLLLEPQSETSWTLPTEHILAQIDEHASEMALLLLPGVQYYTGQFFDIGTITAHAQSKGIVVGWDLAHAAGNVPMQLHDWNVDFAVWCTYKYLNGGPGNIGGCFIHERHSRVQAVSSTEPIQAPQYQYRPRLAGWWGSSKSSRFVMANHFEPMPGAAGYQLSNESVANLSAMRATLDVFKKTSITALREKSLKVTAYVEQLLDLLHEEQRATLGEPLFKVITPRNPAERGAQISVMLNPGLLEHVMETLEGDGVIMDERKPNVVRIAPAPLYNSFQDVRNCIRVLKAACDHAYKSQGRTGESLMVDGGRASKGWSEIK